MDKQLVTNRPDTTAPWRKKQNLAILRDDLKRHFRYFGDKKRLDGLHEFAKKRLFKTY